MSSQLLFLSESIRQRKTIDNLYWKIFVSYPRWAAKDCDIYIVRLILMCLLRPLNLAHQAKYSPLVIPQKASVPTGPQQELLCNHAWEGHLHTLFQGRERRGVVWVVGPKIVVFYLF